MAEQIDKIAKDLAKIIPKTPKTSPYDTEAVIKRIEGDTAWVHIPGGVEETPVKLTINAKKGDVVQVRVGGGRAFLVGNATAPPTDDTKADKVDEKADKIQVIAIDAKELADSANEFAGIAKEAADSAQESANSAQISADNANTLALNIEILANQASDSASEANTAARESNEYAREALASLANVQDVVGTLGWITEHGTYSATTDTQVDKNKAYYIQDGPNSYKLIPVPISTYIADMYEQVINIRYVLTSDTEIDNEKTYYVYDSQNDEYVAVVNPVEADLYMYYEQKTEIEYVLTQDSSPVSGKTYYAYDQIENMYSAETPTSTIGDYYELSIHESVQNYILTHLSLTDDGLTVVKDDNSYYLFLSANGIQIKNSIGTTVAEYGSEIVLGEALNGVRNVITSTRISFRTDSGDIAYFGLSDENIWEMHISNTYVDDMIRFGDYAWIKRDNGNMTIKWLGV